jgi:hypothetical protein
MRRQLCGLVLVLSLVRFASSAQAQALPTSPQEAPAEPGAAKTPHAWLEPGWLAASIGLLPGFVVHGSGAFAIGDRKAARRSLIAEGVGLAAFLAAGSLLAATGSSRRLVGVLVPTVIGGFGVFMLSWLADIYAASTGGRAARAPEFAPWLDAELGYLYVHDPQFAYASFLTARADLRAGAWRAAPQAWVALDDDNQRFLLELGYRPWGARPGQLAADGSFVELATGLRYHRFGSERFAVITPEWHLDGRLDLARMGKSMSGAFVDGQLGAALELYDFDVKGSTLANNAFGLLLMRFGFGVYFGDGGRRSGEAAVYYDHRHDDFAAGLGVQGIASGVLGHFGLRGHYFITREWGLTGLAELGSAVVTGLSVRYRRAPARPQGGEG